jgi:hypothetical protein
MLFQKSKKGRDIVFSSIQLYSISYDLETVDIQSHIAPRHVRKSLDNTHCALKIRDDWQVHQVSNQKPLSQLLYVDLFPSFLEYLNP